MIGRFLRSLYVGRITEYLFEDVEMAMFSTSTSFGIYDQRDHDTSAPRVRHDTSCTGGLEVPMLIDSPFRILCTLAAQRDNSRNAKHIQRRK